MNTRADTTRTQIELLTVNEFESSDGNSLNSIEYEFNDKITGRASEIEESLMFSKELNDLNVRKSEFKIRKSILKRTSTVVQHINIYVGVKDLLYIFLWISCGWLLVGINWSICFIRERSNEAI